MVGVVTRIVKLDLEQNFNKKLPLRPATFETSEIELR